MTQQPSRAFQPPLTHHRDSNREEDHDDPGAPGPVALVADEQVEDRLGSAGIRRSPPSSSSCSRDDQHQDSTSPTTNNYVDPRRGIADFTTITSTTAGAGAVGIDSEDPRASAAVAAASLHASLPAWAVAALQETLEQPWKVHFDGSEDDAERDMSMRNDPDFARERDTVPFYDGRLKVCYGEGSMAA